MDVLARLDETRAAINVLEHPFYQRWSAGELSAGELDRYAGEYRHAVVALAHASAQRRRARRRRRGDAASGLRRHAEEEAAHVALWEQFERAARCRPRPRPRSDRRAARTSAARADARVRARVDGGRGPAGAPRGAVRDRGRPAARSRRRSCEGLTAHYGFSEEGPATEYFRVHELRDVEHAREARELIATADGRRARTPRSRPSGWWRARATRCAATGCCSTASKRPLSQRRDRPRRQAPGEQHGGDGGGEVEARDAGAHRDADARVGAARAARRLRPWRSVPKASTARAGSSAGSSGSPSGSSASSGRSDARAAAPALAGARRAAAKCSPAAPRSASGCQGSWLPVLSTPATSAAAATRTQAPMLPRSRGSSSRTTGAARRVGEHGARGRPRALGERDHAGRGRQRREPLEDLRLDLARERADARR